MTTTPKSYTDRLCECFEGGEEYTSDTIINIIKSFQRTEFDKKKSESTKMPFGKYKGKNVIDIAGFDKPHLEWLLKQGFMDEKFPELKTNIQLALK